MKSDKTFLKFEDEVMRAIIDEDGNQMYRDKLLNQYNSAKVTERKFTGHGFFTDYEISDTQFSLGDINLHLGAVGADLNDMEHGVGFVLFVVDGFISCLEGYAFDEPFPYEIYKYKIK